MKKPIAALSALLLSGGAVFGLASTAYADDAVPTDQPAVVAPADPAPVVEAPAADPTPEVAPAPADDITPPPAIAAVPLVQKLVARTAQLDVDTDYVTTAWLMHSYIDSTTADFSVPQIYQTSTKTDDPELGALDSWISEQKCGLAYQIDVYKDSQKTTTLILGGTLTSPNHPPEDLITGGWGTAYKVVYTGDCAPPPPPTVQSCETTGSVVTTDLSTWYLGETRANGHNVLVPNALHIYTDDASSLAKAAGYYATNFKLSDLGDQTIADSIDYTATTGITPGLQLAVDLDNDGTADGYLVGEAIYGNDWWLSNGTPASFTAPETGGGFGSDRHGTINQWLTVYPDASVKAIGYSLGSGVLGDGLLNRISLGCVDYTFNALAPPAEHRQAVVVSEPDCEVGTVTTTTTNYETPYIWDADSQSYVPGEESQVGEAVVTSTAVTPQECPVVTPVLFSTDPTPPTCEVDGSLVDVTGDFDNVTVTITPAYTGPGDYTITATADGGYLFSDGTTVKTRDITVVGKIATQSENSEAPCYQAPPPPSNPPTNPSILAHTGIDNGMMKWTLISGLSALIIGLISIATLAIIRRRRNNQ